MRSLGAACVLLTLGCGGVSHRDALPDNADGRGGASVVDGVAGSFDAGNGGGAGTLSASDGGAPGAAGGICAVGPVECDAGATYVDVSDSTIVRLAYTTDPTSDPSNEACRIFATGVSSCGVVRLNLSACSAPNGDGVCLDTGSTEPHYTDASGKRWTMLSLSGSSSQPGGPQANGMVDLDLTLSLGSDSTYHELAVHAHVCADISAILPPCK